MKTNNSSLTTKYGVEVFFSGESIYQQINNILSESTTNKKPVLWFFDLDGTLMESGLETEKFPKTIEEWAEENQESVHIFREQIKKLKKKTEMLFGICSGRGFDFIQRVNKTFFPEGVLGECIVEGGIFIYDFVSGEKHYTKCMDKKSVALLLKYRKRIINKIITANGFSESGKELAVSLNPPLGLDIYSFKKEVLSLMKLLESEILEETGEEIDFINNLEINNSSTAIDITPKGASKLEALKEISESKIIGYFGDAENDIPAMGIARINAAPANSVEKIKKLVRSSDIGFIANENTIEGVNKILRLIKAGYMGRFSRIYKNLGD